MNLIYDGITDKGLVREINQDAILMCESDKGCLFCVADGVGGSTGGEKASGLIVDRLTGWMKTPMANPGAEFSGYVESLKEVIYESNRIIKNEFSAEGYCASTLVLLFVRGKESAILSAGDSRIFGAKGFSFLSLTSDDVWENSFSAAGLSDEDKKNHKNHGKLVNAVGIGDEFFLHESTEVLKGKTSFLLCSDGIYRFVKKKELKVALKKGKTKADLNKNLQVLLQRVYEAGAPDNASAILVKLV